MKPSKYLRQNIAIRLPAQSLRRRLAIGVFWSFAATFMAQGLGLIAFAIAARILGKTIFGEFGMIQSTVGTFGILAGLGLGLTATKHVAEFRIKDTIATGRTIAMVYALAALSSALISLIIFIFSPYLAKHIINAPHLALELRIACGLLFFNTLTGVQIGILTGFEAFRTVAAVSLFRGLLNLPLVVIGTYFWGLLGALCGMVCTVAANFVINGFAVRKEMSKANIHVSYRGFLPSLHIIWDFSLPTFLTSAMISPVMWVANAILVNEVSGYAELGVFTVALRFQAILNLAGFKIGTVLLPMLASNDTTKSDRFNRANILISWLLGVIPALPLICFPEIMGLAFGPQYTDISARRTLVLVMCYTCIILYKQGLARVLIANNLMWWGVLSNIVWAVVLIGSFLPLKQFGALGLSVAFVIAYALNTACFVPLYTKRRLAPRGTMISLEAAIIWIVIAGLATISMLEFSLFVRVIGLLASVLPLYMAFNRLFRGL